jgi:response regulator of citrate/malate metabolism
MIKTHDQPQDQKFSQNVLKRLNNIDQKLDQMLTLQTRLINRASIPNTLSSLPEHLRKTAVAIATSGQATARQIAKKTKRTRAAESDYLNQLENRGFLKKSREGREVVFKVSAVYTICPKCAAMVLATLSHCAMCGEPLQIQ